MTLKRKNNQIEDEDEIPSLIPNHETHSIIGDVNLQDNLGWTPFYYRLNQPKSRLNTSEICQLLSCFISKGLNINAINHRNGRPILFSTCTCDISLIKLVIENGFDVKLMDRDGNTFLSWICKLNPRVDIVKYMIEHGADIHKKNNNLESLVCYIRKYITVYDGQKYSELLQFLIEKGVSDIVYK